MNESGAASVLDGLRARWVERWGTVAAGLVDVRLEAAPDGLGGTVVGTVVTRGQLRELRQAFAQTSWRVQVRALVDEPGARAGWWTPGVGAADLYRRPGAEALSTQVLRGEGPVRALVRRGNWLLVEADDGALGWARSEQFVRATRAHGDGPARPLGPGELAAGAPGSARAVWDAARAFESTPYRLGGRSDEHIDCSGLVSLAARRALGVVLPRHSTDQRRCGRRVGFGALRTGDLVFAVWRTRRVPHVGLVERGDDGSVRICHASLGEGRVVVESLDSFARRVRLAGARRWIEEQER